MTIRRLGAAVALAAALTLLACGEKKVSAGSPPPGASSTPAAGAAAAAPLQAAEPKAPPYTYPAPVKGHFKDANVGDFDLVDGLAFPGRGRAGTVVYVVNKPIASPVLVDSPCPMAMAQSLGALRDSGYVEVTLNAAGKSDYFAKGTAYGGTGHETDVGGRYWSAKLAKPAAGYFAGSVRHVDHGTFEFDLPVSRPKTAELSAGDKSKGMKTDESAPTPDEKAVTAAYMAVRAAALKKDLKALLQAQGFDERQIAAIRGLEGIDADLARFSDRFLEPGETGEFQNAPGSAGIVGTGKNSKGEKFLNYYTFAPCAGRLVLVGVGENPQ